MASSISSYSRVPLSDLHQRNVLFSAEDYLRRGKEMAEEFHGNHKEVIDVFKQGLAANPQGMTRFNLNYELGIYLYDCRKYEEAMDYYQRALDLAPPLYFPVVCVAYSTAAYDSKDPSFALEILDRTKGMEITDKRTHNALLTNYVIFYLDKHDWEQAKNHAEQGLKLNPLLNAERANFLKWAARCNVGPEQALHFLEEALKCENIPSKEKAAILLAKGKTLEEKGEKALAYQTYQAALEFAPPHSNIRKEILQKQKGDSSCIIQ